MTNRAPSSAAQTGPTIHRKMTTGPDDEGLIVVRKLVIRGWPVVHTVHSPSAMVTACRFVGKRCRGRRRVSLMASEGAAVSFGACYGSRSRRMRVPRCWAWRWASWWVLRLGVRVGSRW
jgi:hypothetical protein